MSIEGLVALVALIFGGLFGAQKYFKSRGREKEKYEQASKRLEEKKEEIKKKVHEGRKDALEADREIKEINEERRRIHEKAAKDLGGLDDEDVENASDDELSRLVGGLLSS